MTTTRAILAVSFLGMALGFSETPKPLKVMLITGGCCHDYKAQTGILKKGLEERANIAVTEVHVDDGSTKPPLPIYGVPDYAKGYDLVIHDECAAGVSDLETIKGVLKPHEKDGIPGVVLHCAMHSYRQTGFDKKVENFDEPRSMWFEFIGLQSTGHGQQLPIDVTFTDEAKTNPITKGMKDWTTGKEELYNNISVFDTLKPLAKGKQGNTETVVVWTNLYKGKTRVFGTTLGHNNETVSDSGYLDMVTKGALWAMDKLDETGHPKAGYGRVTK